MRITNIIMRPRKTLLHSRCSIMVSAPRSSSSCGRGLFSAVLALLCLALVATGCRLGKPGSASFASVNIEDHTAPQIQEAAGKVFRADGYAAFFGANGQMIFQREGTRANNIGQNGFVGSYYGEQTMIRVVAEIVDLGGNTFRLQCQAYMVRNPGDSMMEDSHPLGNVRRMPYQHLLNKVKSEVKSMPLASAMPPPAPTPAAAPAGK